MDYKEKINELLNDLGQIELRSTANHLTNYFCLCINCPIFIQVL